VEEDSRWDNRDSRWEGEDIRWEEGDSRWVEEDDLRKECGVGGTGGIGSCFSWYLIDYGGLGFGLQKFSVLKDRRMVHG
jgi:hypothetical protein